MKENYQKALKKLTLLFLSNPVPFNGQRYQKQKGPGSSDQSLFRLWNNFRKITLLVIYYLIKFDDVIWSGFWVIPKIASANLCKPIHNINKSFHFHLHFWIWKVWKGRGHKIWISRERKELFRWKKNNTFYSFLTAIIW